MDARDRPPVIVFYDDHDSRNFPLKTLNGQTKVAQISVNTSKVLHKRVNSSITFIINKRKTEVYV